MQEYQTRISGEIRFDVPRAWPREPAAALQLAQRVDTLARLITAVPLEAFRAGAGRWALVDAVSGFEALWPVDALRPPEIAAAIRIVRDGFGEAAG